MADMRTPLNKVRGLGSAKEGADHFWRQRVTALANVPLTIFLIGSVMWCAGKDHAAVAAYLASTPVAIAMTLLVVSAAMHMRLGMQVIIEDYVHGEGAKIVCLILNSFFVISVALACIFSILKLSFGA